jgi:hypothetical protein
MAELHLELLIEIVNYLLLNHKLSLLKASGRLNSVVNLCLKNSHIDVSFSTINNEQLRLFSEAKSINFEGCKKLNYEGFSYLSRVKKIVPRFDIEDENLYYFRNVTELVLANRYNITDFGLEYLTNIEVLNLYDCKNITDKGLSYLENIRKINLTYCERITDKGLSSLRNLETIKIACNDNITDEGFKGLVDLRKVVIRDCIHINGDLLWYLKGLEHIDIRNSKKSRVQLYYDHDYIRKNINNTKIVPLFNLKTIKISRCGWFDGNKVNFLACAREIIILFCNIKSEDIEVLNTFKNIRFLQVSREIN